MIRWIAIAASLLMLSGCVTTEYVYRDRYYDGHVVDGRYVGQDRYVDGSYYAPGGAGRGDYYYAPDYYSWYDYPAYSSVFWPLHRSWYDPYRYPNYYYGVTFFPRNYLSIGVSYGWPRYSSWYYSPYRYSWVDNYYDWRPWYGGRHHRHYSPRYGSARNEAERLSRRADEGWGYGRNAGRGAGWSDDRRDERTSDAVRRTPYGTYGTTRDRSRDADYGSISMPRRDGSAAAQYERAPRQDPGTRGFGVPVEPGTRGEAGHVRGYSRDAQYGAARGEVRRRGDYEVPASGCVRQSPREYARPDRGGYEAQAGGYEVPARNYERGGQDSGARSAPSFQAPPQQTFQAPEPSYRQEAPRYESAREADYSRSESRAERNYESRSEGGSRGEVRRVGNNRDD